MISDLFNHGPSSPYIILEAGINHNGDLRAAKNMAKVAKGIGADAIKFQTYKASELILDNQLKFTYKSQGSNHTESMLEMFQRYELEDSEWLELAEYCESIGIEFFSSPQNVNDAVLLDTLGVAAFKVGSDDFINHLFLEQLVSLDKPMILSIGMADYDEVESTINFLQKRNATFSLMVCTSEYPASSESLNLKRITTLINSFPEIEIGFSDHSIGSVGAISAVALGATFFEKHFTLDNNMQGPDHWFSENPESAKVWIEKIRAASKVLGSGDVAPSLAELDMRYLARRSIHIGSEGVKKGCVIEINNLVTFRPGDGVLGIDFDSVVGKKAFKDLSPYVKVDLNDIG